MFSKNIHTFWVGGREKKHITNKELLFDLFYVVIFSIITHRFIQENFHQQVMLVSSFFVLLFIWQDFTYLHIFFDTDTWISRILFMLVSLPLALIIVSLQLREDKLFAWAIGLVSLTTYLYYYAYWLAFKFGQNSPHYSHDQSKAEQCDFKSSYQHELVLQWLRDKASLFIIITFFVIIFKAIGVNYIGDFNVLTIANIVFILVNYMFSKIYQSNIPKFKDVEIKLNTNILKERIQTILIISTGEMFFSLKNVHLTHNVSHDIFIILMVVSSLVYVSSWFFWASDILHIHNFLFFKIRKKVENTGETLMKFNTFVKFKNYYTFFTFMSIIGLAILISSTNLIVELTIKNHKIPEELVTIFIFSSLILQFINGIWIFSKNSTALENTDAIDYMLSLASKETLSNYVSKSFIAKDKNKFSRQVHNYLLKRSFYSTIFSMLALIMIYIAKLNNNIIVIILPMLMSKAYDIYSFQKVIWSLSDPTKLYKIWKNN